MSWTEAGVSTLEEARAVSSALRQHPRPIEVGPEDMRYFLVPSKDLMFAQKGTGPVKFRSVQPKTYVRRQVGPWVRVRSDTYEAVRERPDTELMEVLVHHGKGRDDEYIIKDGVVYSRVIHRL